MRLKIAVVVVFLLSFLSPSLYAQSDFDFVRGVSLEGADKWLSTVYEQTDLLIVFNYYEKSPSNEELNSLLGSLKTKSSRDKKKGDQSVIYYIKSEGESRGKFGSASTHPKINKKEFMESVNFVLNEKVFDSDADTEDLIDAFISTFVGLIPLNSIPMADYHVPRSCDDTFGGGNWEVCLDGNGPNCCAKDANCNSGEKNALPACCPMYTKSKSTGFAGGVNYCPRTDKYCENRFGKEYTPCGSDCCYEGPTIPGEKIKETCSGLVQKRCVKAKGKCDESIGEIPCPSNSKNICCLSYEECISIGEEYACVPKKEACEKGGGLFCPSLPGSKYSSIPECCNGNEQCWWHPDGAAYCVPKISSDFALAGPFGGINERVTT